jgi:hypothetical protein
MARSSHSSIVAAVAMLVAACAASPTTPAEVPSPGRATPSVATPSVATTTPLPSPSPPVAAPTGPAPTGTELPATSIFTSRVYDYSIAISGDYEAVAAGQPGWNSGEPWEWGADRFVAHWGQSIRIASAPVPEGVTAAEWIDRFERPSINAGNTPCRESPSDWLPMKIGAETGWYRGTRTFNPGDIRVGVPGNQCNNHYVEAYVIAGGRVYVVTTTFRRTQESLDEFLRTIEFPARSFTSAVNGYTIGYPSDWEVTAATQDWSGEGEWDVAPIADVFDPPEDGCDRTPFVRCTLRRLAVASTPVPAATSIDDWITTHVPERLDVKRWDHGGGDFHPVCMIRGAPGQFLVDAASGEWVHGTIGGRPARIRGQCGFVEGVTIAGGRAYVFSLFTDFNPGGSSTELEALTRTVTFPR